MGVFNIGRVIATDSDKVGIIWNGEVNESVTPSVMENLAPCELTNRYWASLDMQTQYGIDTTEPKEKVLQTKNTITPTLELETAAAGLVSSATIGDATINNKADSQIIYRGGGADNFRFNS